MKESKFKLLARVASEKEEAAAERMSQAQNKLTQAKAKLAQLESFVDEYQERLTTKGSKGTSIVEWQDFRLFLSRLHEAVINQQRQVDRDTQYFLLERHAWQDASKMHKIYEKLVSRDHERVQQSQKRSEQKALDELALSRVWVRIQRTQCKEGD